MKLCDCCSFFSASGYPVMSVEESSRPSPRALLRGRSCRWSFQLTIALGKCLEHFCCIYDPTCCRTPGFHALSKHHKNRRPSGSAFRTNKTIGWRTPQSVNSFRNTCALLNKREPQRTLFKKSRFSSADQLSIQFENGKLVKDTSRRSRTKVLMFVGGAYSLTGVFSRTGCNYAHHSGRCVLCRC